MRCQLALTLTLYGCRTVSDFNEQCIRTGANLQLAELNATVTAVGHPVCYDGGTDAEAGDHGITSS
jgi:hypothetical protein